MDWSSISVVGSIILGAVSLYFATKKDRVDAQLKDKDGAAKLVGASMEMYDRMEKRVDELQEDIDKLNVRVSKQQSIIRKWMKGIEELTRQIQSLGHIPCWKPEEAEMIEVNE